MEEWVLCSWGFLFSGDCDNRFDSEPEVKISSIWDSTHILASWRGGERSVTLGRWKRIVDKVQGHLHQDERITKIREVGSRILLWTTEQRILASEEMERDDMCVYDLKVFSSSIETFLYVEGSGLSYVFLASGTVHQSTFTGGTKQLVLSPALKLGMLVESVACGSDHVVLLERQHWRVWSFGQNYRGQLGLGDVVTRGEPCVVEALDGVAMRMVACGNWHTLALSHCGDVYSWGWNTHKQLGHSPDVETVAIPTLVETEEDLSFQCVSCGARHSAALTECGRLLTWGWNGYGQLGHYHPTGPALCKVEGTVSLVQCGHWNTVFVQKTK